MLDWVGYRIDLKNCTLGVTESRRQALIGWCEAVSGGELTLIRDMRTHLGRLVFVAGPLQHVRPFLGPAFAWVAACRGGAALVAPVGVRASIKWIGMLLQKVPVRSCAEAWEVRRRAVQDRRKGRGEGRGHHRGLVDGPRRGREGRGVVLPPHHAGRISMGL